jgi:predicted Ser/Thr protein kinase
VILAVAFGAVALLIGIVIIIVIVRRKKQTPRDSQTEDFGIALRAPSKGTVEGIIVRERIGGGEFGEVYRGIWNGTPVALKLFISEKKLTEFKREANILQ